MKKIDNIDQCILSILEENGRAKYVDIAKCVGLSQTSCTERIRRLEREGYITKYAACLNAGLIDRGFTVFIQVTLTDSSNDTFEIFSNAIRNMKEIVECHMVAGKFDCILKTCVKNMGAFRTLLVEKISPIPGIAHTNSFAAIEVIKAGEALMSVNGIDQK